MGLLGRILAPLYPQPSPEDNPADQDPAKRGNQLSVTLLFGRGELRLEIGPPARPDDAERMPAVAEMIPPPRSEADGEEGSEEGSTPHWSMPPLAPGGAQQSPGAASFWDALDPTEREALRSVASWRTFAAGATIMQEGERADHVIVILGGRARICVEENGRERVLAERGLGQLVGERGALQVSVRSATVIALEMVWALVVQTKDFAAFISSHSRVLALVQNQRYDRSTDEPTGYGHDNGDRANFRTGPAGRIATDQPDGFTAEHPQPLQGENCSVILTDVVAFGASMRTDRDRLIIREALSRMTNAALQGMPDAWSEDRGDGILTVIPPNVSTAKALDRLIHELPRALDRHNSSQRSSARFQLRLAVNVGPVVSDTMGVSGEAIIVTARLVEAPDFKQALARSTANLGVIASPFVYETVIRHGQDPSYVASYSQVPVEVKESRTTAWMKLFDAPLPTYLIPAPSPPGSTLSLLAALKLAHEPYPLGQGETQLRAVCVLAVTYGDKPRQITCDFYAAPVPSAVAALAPRSARQPLIVHWSRLLFTLIDLICYLNDQGN